jgi:hypothetical protein
VEQDRDPADTRSTRLRLAARGVTAMRDSSVLEPSRVQRMLARLAPADRRAALDGLSILARAARGLMEEEKRDG